MKTPTEKMYGSYSKLVAEGSYDLASKVEAEKAKLGLFPVDCVYCGRTRFFRRDEVWDPSDCDCLGPYD